MYVDKLIIDVKKLISSNLTLEQHFILDCIHKNSQALLEEYVDSVGKLDKVAINKLIDLNYINNIEGEITFNKLKLSKKGIEYLGSDVLDHARFFKELREVYPKRVKVGKAYRSLHQNLDNIAKKYKNIVTSEELHRNILKCVKLYIKELTDSNRLEYIQMLSTWINEKNYEVFIEEAISINEFTENEENYDVI